jgi:hypothetical protein
LFLSVLFLFSTIAAAQAWVPEKGEGTATLTLQDIFVKDHLGSGGQRFDVGHIRTFIAFQDIDYGITDKLALDASIPCFPGTTVRSRINFLLTTGSTMATFKMSV